MIGRMTVISFFMVVWLVVAAMFDALGRKKFTPLKIFQGFGPTADIYPTAAEILPHQIHTTL